jgi:hypothetical protein
MKVNYLEKELPPIGILLDFLERGYGTGERIPHKNSCSRGQIKRLAAPLVAEQGERLLLPSRGSRPKELAVAQEHLVSGTAESSCQNVQLAAQ